LVGGLGFVVVGGGDGDVLDETFSWLVVVIVVRVIMLMVAAISRIIIIIIIIIIIVVENGDYVGVEEWS